MMVGYNWQTRVSEAIDKPAPNVTQPSNSQRQLKRAVSEPPSQRRAAMDSTDLV